MAMTESKIEGVEFKKLDFRHDERGFFTELIRSTDDFFEEGFGQWSMSHMYNGVIKAWHLHEKQIDWWFVASGVIRVGLCDLRPSIQNDNLSAIYFDEQSHSELSKNHRFLNDKTYISQDSTMDFLVGGTQCQSVFRIPPGVAHGCKVIQGPVTLFYITSEIYDPNDELRIKYDDPSIGFDWHKQVIT